VVGTRGRLLVIEGVSCQVWRRRRLLDRGRSQLVNRILWAEKKRDKNTAGEVKKGTCAKDQYSHELERL